MIKYDIDYIKFLFSHNNIIYLENEKRLKTVRKTATISLMLDNDTPACVECGIEGKFFGFHSLKPHEFHLFYGEKKTQFLTLDHIIPKASGGGNNRINQQIMCRSCNAQKGSKITHDMETYINFQDVIGLFYKKFPQYKKKLKELISEIRYIRNVEKSYDVAPTALTMVELDILKETMFNVIDAKKQLGIPKRLFYKAPARHLQDGYINQ